MRNLVHQLVQEGLKGQSVNEDMTLQEVAMIGICRRIDYNYEDEYDIVVTLFGPSHPRLLRQFNGIRAEEALACWQPD
jgi:hypothetical protein